MRRKALALAAAGIAATATAAYGAGHALLLGPTTKTSEKSFLGYYDGHKDVYLSTDVSSKAEAKAMHVNYAPAIGRVKGLPEIYLVQGRAAKGQLAIFGSEPGEADYSPLWSETILTWKAGAKPTVIKSDTQIDKIEKTGKLSERDAHVVLNCPIIKVG